MVTKAHDGSDFKHRQKIAPHYQRMALDKKRLKFVLYLHLLLGFLMTIKILPTILDELNIFIQPIEELFIPMAQHWEWIWLLSLLIVSSTFRTIRTNNAFRLKIFLAGIVLTCVFPLLYCAYHYSTDLYTFYNTRDAKKTSEVWKGYPVALFWYIFIVVAYQVHFFELYFGKELLSSLNSHHRTK